MNHFSGTFTYLLIGSPQTATNWTVKGTGHADDLLIYDHVGQTADVVGRDGDDKILTYKGDDTLRGGSGIDQGNAGPGTDVCESIEQPSPPAVTTGCETTIP